MRETPTLTRQLATITCKTPKTKSQTKTAKMRQTNPRPVTCVHFPGARSISSYGSFSAEMALDSGFVFQIARPLPRSCFRAFMIDSISSETLTSRVRRSLFPHAWIIPHLPHGTQDPARLSPSSARPRAVTLAPRRFQIFYRRGASQAEIKSSVRKRGVPNGIVPNRANMAIFKLTLGQILPAVP